MSKANSKRMADLRRQLHRPMCLTGDLLRAFSSKGQSPFSLSPPPYHPSYLGWYDKKGWIGLNQQSGQPSILALWWPEGDIWSRAEQGGLERSFLEHPVSFCRGVYACTYISIYTHFPFEKHITHYLQPPDSVKPWLMLHPAHCLLLSSGCHHHHTKLVLPQQSLVGCTLFPEEARGWAAAKLHTAQIHTCILSSLQLCVWDKG